MSTYTDADVNEAIVALFKSKESDLRFADTARAVLDAVGPAIAARALREAAEQMADTWPRAHVFGWHEKFLNARADEIERTP